MSEERSEKNCKFYPACYIEGTCGKDDWKRDDCGLPRPQQEEKRKKFWADTRQGLERFKLSERLKREALSGKLDHLLTKEDRL